VIKSTVSFHVADKVVHTLDELLALLGEELLELSAAEVARVGRAYGQPFVEILHVVFVVKAVLLTCIPRVLLLPVGRGRRRRVRALLLPDLRRRLESLQFCEG